VNEIELAWLRQFESYYENELEYDNRIATDQRVDRKTPIRGKKKTAADVVELQNKLENVRRQIRELSLGWSTESAGTPLRWPQ
jgi:hypothetical protein